MKPMLDCDAVMRQLWDYLDGELTEDRLAAIAEHISMCARCQPQLDFERSFVEAIAQARREHSDPPALAAKVRRALVEKGFRVA